MITSGSKTSQITRNTRKLSLNTSQILSEKLTLKLLCDVIFLSLPGHTNIPCFLMVNFHLDDCLWQLTFPNHAKLKNKPLATFQAVKKKTGFKLLSDVILSSLNDQSDVPCFTITSFKLYEYHWSSSFSNHTKLKQKTFMYISRHIARPYT